MVASTRGFRGTVRRRVALFAGGALLVTGAVWSAPGTARADAGNPILGTIHGSLQPNPDGTVTVFVRGQWNWLSHNSDCNFDRAATGVGMIWNDPTEPGFTVTKAPISAGVGIAAIRSGTAPAGENPNAYPDTYNTVDEMVHPVDRGNQAEGYTSGTFKSTTQGYSTSAAGDFPSGQRFSDPASPAPTNANLALWRGVRPRAAHVHGLEERPLRRGDEPDLCQRHHHLLRAPVGLLGLREGDGDGERLRPHLRPAPGHLPGVRKLLRRPRRREGQLQQLPGPERHQRDRRQRQRGQLDPDQRLQHEPGRQLRELPVHRPHHRSDERPRGGQHPRPGVHRGRGHGAGHLPPV